MKNEKYFSKGYFVFASILLGFSSTNIWASATLDGTTSGGNTTQFSGTGLNFTIDQSVGLTEGTNLFHSFSSFNIDTGEAATFTGDASINNVISRVTGDSSSTINGSLTSAIESANFYFINPNGVVFKEGASINVDGSFYASTSDFIRLGDDGTYYSNLTTDSVMTSSPPSSFGFLDNNIGNISLEGTQLLKGYNLLQPDGATFSLIGGNTTFDKAADGISTLYGGTSSTGSFIYTAGDRFEVVSVASSGEVTPTTGGYDLTSFTSLGDVSIVNGSIIDSTDVYIRSGNISIENSIIAPGFFYLPYFYSELNSYGFNVLGAQNGISSPSGTPVYVAPNGGNIDVNATHNLNIAGSSPLYFFINYPGYEGVDYITGYGTGVPPLPRPGFEYYVSGITTYGGNPLTDAFAAYGMVSPPTDITNINVNAENVTLSGAAGIISERYGAGLAGDININAGTVDIRAGALIANINTYYGAGGNININADQVILDHALETSNVTGIFSTSTFNPLFGLVNSPIFFSQYFSHADSGNITVNATGENGLTIKTGASISSDSRALGNAGNIAISASDINLSRDGSVYGSISSQSAYAGNSGSITIHSTNNINISSGFEIAATVQGIGTGGDISITADNNISITGQNSGIASATTAPSEQIKYDLARRYGSANYDALISDMNAFYNLYFPGTLIQPDANMYTVMAALQYLGFMNLLGQSPIAGNAGSITLAASTLNMSDPSRITSSTTSDGNGGTINIQVDKLAMSKGAEIRSRSGLYNQTTGLLEVGAGNGGDISILAQESVSMKSGSSISSSSLGDGLAGNILLNAGDALKMINSSITTEATVSDGGNITIIAEKEIYLDQSDITTSVESGLGSGGNIDIDPDFFILRGSNILANAYGGDGGNIDLVAKHFITSADSSIDASSALGMDGEVNMSSPAEDVSDDLAVLPDNYLDVTNLISERCGSSSGSSSLVDVGSSGIAVDPDGYLPSFAVAENITNANNIKNTASSQNKQWSKAYIDQSELSLSQLACSAI